MLMCFNIMLREVSLIRVTLCATGLGIFVLLSLNVAGAQDWLGERNESYTRDFATSDHTEIKFQSLEDRTLQNYLYRVDQQCDTIPLGQKYLNIRPPTDSRFESGAWANSQNIAAEIGGTAFQHLGFYLGTFCGPGATVCIPALGFTLEKLGEETGEIAVGYLRDALEFQDANVALRNFLDFEYNAATFIDPDHGEVYFKARAEWQNYLSGLSDKYLAIDSRLRLEEIKYRKNQREMEEQRRRQQEIDVRINSNPGRTIDDHRWEQIQEWKRTG